VALIAPSILTADFLALGEELRRVARAPWLHLDVMDGHFVPQLTFGPLVVEACGRAFPGALEVHLMTEHPLAFLPDLDAGRVRRLYMHLEVLGDERGVQEAIRAMRRLGFLAGVALNPATALEPFWPTIAEADAVLVMTVPAGRGGQTFQEAQLAKVVRLRELGYRGVVGVDGGVNRITLPLAVAAGADLLVVGSAIFDGRDPEANLDELLALLAEV
jgi:ribulose-phosphate 3-epimerase